MKDYYILYEIDVKLKIFSEPTNSRDTRVITYLSYRSRTLFSMFFQTALASILHLMTKSGLEYTIITIRWKWKNRSLSLMGCLIPILMSLSAMSSTQVSTGEHCCQPTANTSLFAIHYSLVNTSRHYSRLLAKNDQNLFKTTLESKTLILKLKNWI